MPEFKHIFRSKDPIVIKQITEDESSNLIEFQNSLGVVVASISNTGSATGFSGVGVGAVPTGNFFPVYNVKSAPYLATGNGVTDDMAAIMVAINACGQAGGGVVYFPPGNYRVASTYAGNSLGALLIAYDNIQIVVAPGARVFSELSSQGVFVVAGNAKPTSSLPSGSTDNWFQYGTFAKITAPSVGDTKITFTNAGDAAAYVAGDLIYIRSGELISGQSPNSHHEPDAEVAEVSSVSGSDVLLREPIVKGFVQEYFPTANSPTTTNGATAQGATVVPVASTVGFTVNEDITIIGTAGNPSHQSAILSIQAGVSLTIKHALEQAIPSGAAVHRGVGVTTTSVTTALAVLGARKVTGYMVNNFRIWGGGTVENSFSSASMIWMNQVRDISVSYCILKPRTSAIVGNNMTDAEIVALTVRCVPNPGEGTYWFGAGTGSKNISLSLTEARSGQFTGIVFSEGTYNGQCTQNSNLCAKTANAGDTPFAVQTRSQALIKNNVVRGGGTDSGVFVASSCTRGGEASYNDISGGGAGSKAYNIQPTGWKIDGHRVLVLTYGTTITPDMSSDINEIQITDGVAFTIASPLNPQVGFLTIRLRNNFGTPGAVTWNSNFKLVGGALAAPGIGSRNTITFYYSGSATQFTEVSRSVNVFD